MIIEINTDRKEIKILQTIPIQQFLQELYRLLGDQMLTYKLAGEKYAYYPDEEYNNLLSNG